MTPILPERRKLVVSAYGKPQHRRRQRAPLNSFNPQLLERGGAAAAAAQWLQINSCSPPPPLFSYLSILLRLRLPECRMPLVL